MRRHRAKVRDRTGTEKTQYPVGTSTHSRTTARKAEPPMWNSHSSTSRVEMVRKIEDLSAERESQMEKGQVD